MSKFTDEDNKEATLKAFELFAMCMAAGPCNNCVFFDRDDDNLAYEVKCSIGHPNSWPLFDPTTTNGLNNRNLVINSLHRKEK